MEQKKHKHYDVIIAYANGATIEWRSPLYHKGDDGWETIDYPGFHEQDEYRVKKNIVKKYLLLYKSENNKYYYLQNIWFKSKQEAETVSTMYETVDCKFIKVVEIEEEENA
jgi:hypothetical protein